MNAVQEQRLADLVTQAVRDRARMAAQLLEARMDLAEARRLLAEHGIPFGDDQ